MKDIRILRISCGARERSLRTPPTAGAERKAGVTKRATALGFMTASQLSVLHSKSRRLSSATETMSML